MGRQAAAGHQPLGSLEYMPPDGNSREPCAVGLCPSRRTPQIATSAPAARYILVADRVGHVAKQPFLAARAGPRHAESSGPLAWLRSGAREMTSDERPPAPVSRCRAPRRSRLQPGAVSWPSVAGARDVLPNRVRFAEPWGRSVLHGPYGPGVGGRGPTERDKGVAAFEQCRPPLLPAPFSAAEAASDFCPLAGPR